MEAESVRRNETLDRLERDLGLIDLAMEQADRGDLESFDLTMSSLGAAAPPISGDPAER